MGGRGLWIEPKHFTKLLNSFIPAVRASQCHSQVHVCVRVVRIQPQRVAIMRGAASSSLPSALSAFARLQCASA